MKNKNIEIVDLTKDEKKDPYEKIINYSILVILLIFSGWLVYKEDCTPFCPMTFSNIVTASLVCLFLQLIRCIVIFIKG